MRSLGWAHIQNDCVLIKKGNLAKETHIKERLREETQGERHGKMKAEIRMMYLQAKEHRIASKSPADKRFMEQIVPLSLQRKPTLWTR